MTQFQCKNVLFIFFEFYLRLQKMLSGGRKTRSIALLTFKSYPCVFSFYKSR